MKKERFKRRIKKITAFAAAMAMAVSVMFPGEAFGNIDFGITVFAEESGYTKGFCDTYTEGTECSAHGADCNGYQPATLTTDKYDIDGVDGYDNVYEIGNAGQLYWFAALVNGTNGLTRNSSANAVLTADITVNTGDVANCGGTKQVGWKDWTPIGNYIAYYVSYEGTFDGQNHTISGLFFNNSSTNYVGLFGYNKGTIKNVGVVDSYFNGNKDVGGVCGSIRCGTITNCYNTGTVSGTDSVGGVYGNNDCGTITNCYNTGTVSGARFVGGVCGSNGESGCTLTNCYNTGKVSGNNNIGGVCGYNYYSKITNCYNTGEVSGADPVGGVCGQTVKGTIANSYFNSTVYSGNAVGTNKGGTVSDNVLGKTTKQFKSGEVCYLLNGEKSVGTAKNPLAWYQNIDNGANDDYPLLDSGHGTVYYGYDDSQNLKYSNSSLKAELNHDYTNNNGFCTGCGAYEPATLTTDKYDIDGDNRKDNVYEIGNAGQLYWFAALVNGTNGLTQNLGANAILTNNITINDNVLVNGELNSANEGRFRKWTPIGYTSDKTCAYTGTFDGKGKTISGLYYSEDTSVKTYAGLFGYNQGAISNITIEDSCFYLSSSGGLPAVAAIVGRNEGTVKYCKNTGTINGTATNNYRVGGICGVNANQITNCNNEGIVNVTDQVANETQSSIGGICGQSVGKITDCNNTGKVCVKAIGGVKVGGVCGDHYKGGTIDNCHNTADVNVSGNSSSLYYVGGVCGYNDYGVNSITTISNCSNTGNITGLGDVGGVCGYNNAFSGKCIIINTYNTGTVSGSGTLGGICGHNVGRIYSKITNCYFNSDVFLGEAVGYIESGTVTNTEGKSTAKFESGEVCYLLNNGTTDGTQVWYQTLNSDSYPLLDNSHGTVYASAPCPSKFSNTNNLEAEEHNYVANADYTKHTCTKCGETHDAKFTAYDETNTISVCHGFGSVTLTAPTENLTYDGTEKAATVTGEIEGFDTPKIFYKEKNATGDAAETAPVNAGTYIASITYTDKASNESTVSVEYTIEKAELTVEAGTYKVSKGYDGTKNAGTGSGEFKVTGLAAGDSVTINADSIGSYSSAEVGESNVEVDISLTGNANYKLGNTKVTVPAEITPQSINPTCLVVGNYTYTGLPIIPNVSVQTDGALNGGQPKVYEKDKDYTITVTDNINAGKGKVTFKPVSGGNYTFDEQTVDFTIGKGTPTITAAPTAKAITYGQTLSASTLSDTKWSWVDGTVIPTIKNNGYAVKMTVDDSNYDYTDVDGYDSDSHTVTRTIDVTVERAQAKVLTAPTAITDLVYDGNAKALVNEGTVSGGTMVYGLDGTSFSAAIPTATEAGTYTVYYKVSGDENHTDSEVGQVSVTIYAPIEIITEITVSDSAITVTYGYKGTTITTRTENVAFADVTVGMVELMKNSNIQLVIDFVNYSTAGDDIMLLTAAQMKAIEYVLDYDYGITA